MQWIKNILLAVCCGSNLLLAACGSEPQQEGPTKAELLAALEGEIAIAAIERSRMVRSSVAEVGGIVEAEGTENVPVPSVVTLQYAWSGATKPRELGITPNLPQEAQEQLERIERYTERELTALGEPFTPPPMPPPRTLQEASDRRMAREVEEETVRRMGRRYGEGAGGGVEGSVINIETPDDLATGIMEGVSRIIDGIAGAAEAVGRTVHNLQGAILCMQEVAFRSAPAALQYMNDADDPAVYLCRAACMQSAVVPTVGWCFYESQWFLEAGPDEVLARQGRHLTEPCTPIDAADIARSQTHLNIACFFRSAGYYQ
ncbi:hypothetical protein HYW17_05340 [Candidatus Uhrbacteria bacterium]|nr:hypothetical protein [Candidatus Uhrbacteria bacterium]